MAPPARLLPYTRYRAGITVYHRDIQAPDIHTKFQRVRTGYAEQLSFRQVTLDGTPVRRQVTTPVRDDTVGRHRSPEQLLPRVFEYDFHRGLGAREHYRPQLLSDEISEQVDRLRERTPSGVIRAGHQGRIPQDEQPPGG